MILMRCVRESDIEGIHKLTKHIGVGLTTLPENKELLKQRLSLAVESFAKNVTAPTTEYYLFVLEDAATKKVIGTSAIQAITGFEAPFYSYHLSKYSRISHSLNIRSEYEVLNLVNDNQGRSELCTLFLDPQYHKHHYGLLLSKARFVFMAQHPKRFAESVIAELRGMVNKKNQSPFWEHVGKHFFHMPFAQADQLNLKTNKQFIEDLMPQNPIYVPLLDPEAQEAIGNPHHATIPARSILLHEGFRFNNYVHIFDAGPILEANRADIKTVHLSQELVVSGISDEVNSKEYIIANTLLDFRATSSTVLIHDLDKTCIISKETAKLLQIQVKDKVRVAPLSKNMSKENKDHNA